MSGTLSSAGAAPVALAPAADCREYLRNNLESRIAACRSAGDYHARVAMITRWLSIFVIAASAVSTSSLFIVPSVISVSLSVACNISSLVLRALEEKFQSAARVVKYRAFQHKLEASLATLLRSASDSDYEAVQKHIEALDADNDLSV